MIKYREAAVHAVSLVTAREGDHPVTAWEKSTKKVFPSSTHLRDKGCPKGAFLGLCNEGLIKGIDAGEYAKATKNGAYAVKAIAILKRNRFLVSQPDLLWKKIAPSITHNHQLEVVIGLWEAELIR